MKNILFLSFLLLGIQKVQSQLIVMNDKMNIVYYGVDNPISFSVNGYDSKQLILKASCGELRKTAEGYVWKICGEKVNRVSFTCFLKRGSKIINFGQSDYRVKEVPDPVILLGPSEHTRVRNRLHNLLFINVQLLNFEFDAMFTVTQFDLEIYRKQGNTLFFNNTGARINDEIREQMQKLHEGDRICIKNVFVKIADCEFGERKLQDSVFATYYE